MQNLELIRSQDGARARTPYAQIPPGPSEMRGTLQLEVHAKEDGKPAKMMACVYLTNSISTKVIQEELTAVNFEYGTAVANLLREHFEEIMEFLYTDHPDQLQEELNRQQDWRWDQYKTTCVAWKIREDARLYGAIEYGDYVILQKPYIGECQIMQFDNQVIGAPGFVDPQRKDNSAKKGVDFDTHKPRRLTSETIREVRKTHPGPIKSSEGAWSSHAIMEMLIANQRNLEKERQKGKAYGFA